MGRAKKSSGPDLVIQTNPAEDPLAGTRPEPEVKTSTAPDLPDTNSPLREYMAGAEPWRVNRFDLLETEFAGTTSEDLALFHEVMAIHTRGWMILRRLFGICAVIPKQGTPEDDLRTWSREELMDSLGITAAHLREEMERLRGVWKGAKPKEDGGSKKEENITASRQRSAGQKGRTELDFAQEELVRRHGMGELLTRDEVPWMAGRLEASSQVINHPQVSELMRMALLTELELRRYATRMAKTSKEYLECPDAIRRITLEKEHEWVSKQRTSLLAVYNNQIEKIEAFFPYMKQSATALSMKAVFSDAIVCHTEWYKDRANCPVDGVFTAGEMEILMRMSAQAPEAQYRAGQAMYLNEARAKMFDKDWRGEFAPNVLKKVDAAYKAAAEAVSKADGETLTDLLSDDPILGEYQAVGAGKGEK